MTSARLALLVLALAAAPAAAGVLRCGPDAVKVGTVCVDRYEESVWSIPPDDPTFLSRLQRGRLTFDDLLAAGATQMGRMPEGCLGGEYGPTFPTTGNWTAPLYAVSVAGVLPSTCITWFQAEQACRLSGKRLLTNEEWQAAAAGTPDPGAADDQTTTCATASTFGQPTGSRSACVSSWGTYDQVGNAWEWVAEWTELADDCIEWPPEFGQDFSCIGSGMDATAGVSSFFTWPPRVQPAGFRRVELSHPIPHEPGGIIRGGNFGIGIHSGVFAIYAGAPPLSQSRSISFRCAR